jgi:ATP-dependent Zn protease
MADKLLLSGKGNIKDLNEDERGEIEAILHEAKTKCYNLLSSHKDLLIELTQKLLEKKTLLKAEILELIKEYQN